MNPNHTQGRPPPTNELTSDGAKIRIYFESSKKKRQKKKISAEMFGSMKKSLYFCSVKH